MKPPRVIMANTLLANTLLIALTFATFANAQPGGGGSLTYSTSTGKFNGTITTNGCSNNLWGRYSAVNYTGTAGHQVRELRERSHVLTATEQREVMACITIRLIESASRCLRVTRHECL